MKKIQLLETIGKIDDKFISEIQNERKEHSKIFYLKRFAMATFVICLTVLTSYTVYAMKITKEYNAAVGYLQSLGIDVEDLSDYSKKEIIGAVNDYKFGLDNEIIDNLMDSSNIPTRTLTSVTSKDIEKLQPNMTYNDVIEILGDTIDVGSGFYILNYKVDDKYILSIPFTTSDSELGVYGKDLLKALQPIE